MKFENTIVINKSAKEVFAYLADVERLPDWNYAIKRTVQQTTGAVGVGTRYTQERTLPRPMTEALEITAYQPDALLVLRGGFGPFPVGTSTYQLEATGTTQTTLHNTIALEAKGMLQLAAPLAMLQIKTAVGKNLDALKRILETQ